jgi:hypothetical protein
MPSPAPKVGYVYKKVNGELVLIQDVKSEMLVVQFIGPHNVQHEVPTLIWNTASVTAIGKMPQVGEVYRFPDGIPVVVAHIEGNQVIWSQQGNRAMSGTLDLEGWITSGMLVTADDDQPRMTEEEAERWVATHQLRHYNWTYPEGHEKFPGQKWYQVHGTVWPKDRAKCHEHITTSAQTLVDAVRKAQAKYQEVLNR